MERGEYYTYVQPINTKETSARRWGSISFDFITSLPPSGPEGRNAALIVVACRVEKRPLRLPYPQKDERARRC